MGRRHTVDESSINERLASEGASRAKMNASPSSDIMSSKSIWLRKSAPVKDRCGQTHNCVVVGMAPPEDVASEGPMRPKMHKTTGSNGLLRLRLGSDRVREARPVLLVGNFDWIGSASRSLRFTARTAPRLRRHQAQPARAAPPSHP